MNRSHLAAQRQRGGVHAAQHLQAQRGVFLDERLELAHREVGAIERREESQIRRVVRGQRSAGLNHRAAEVVALEQRVAGLPRGVEHLARLDLLGHHRHAMRLVALGQLQDERHVGQLHVDLHERDVRHQL
ncbi:MAG TPA: hypothetical protein VFN64_06860, partial [Burkholderiaceae bacterium]|nr:hypothetical protein [Burkholderiaceae bacterium]